MYLTQNSHSQCDFAYAKSWLFSLSKNYLASFARFQFQQHFNVPLPFSGSLHGSGLIAVPKFDALNKNTGMGCSLRIRWEVQNRVFPKQTGDHVCDSKGVPQMYQAAILLFVARISHISGSFACLVFDSPLQFTGLR
jgi:hypothetical protein